MKKLALIGCGGIGGYHLEHFLKYTDVEVAGVCDLIPERAQDYARKAGCKPFTNFIEMYDAVKPDMVFIGIPPTQHGEIELETIRRRIPLFVEKPIALDLGLAKRISAEIGKAGLVSAVGFQCRYSNICGPTLQFVQDHKIIFTECARIGSVPGTPWWRVRSLSGGQLVEQTIHQLDIIRYTLGEPEVVYSMSARGFIDMPGYDTDDLSVSVVRFANGGLASISTGCYASAGAAFDSKITFGASDCRLDHYIISKVDIYGEKPAAPEGSGLVVKGDGTLAAAGKEGVRTIKDDGSAGEACDRTFVDAAISGDPSKIRSPYADALKSLAFGLAANESMVTGKAVKVQI
ncbi:MAG: Gfo/Idh/MocA family protein [Anaerolineae bacterium]